MAGFGILLWVSTNVASVILLVLVSQQAVQSAAAGIQEGPPDNRLIESPVGSSAGPQDQRHVLERFVHTHHGHIPQHCLHFMSVFLSHYALSTL